MATSKQFVAVSDVKHGEEDGSVTHFKRGEVVKGLGKDHMVGLWASGSLAVKGSPEDPNTWPDNPVTTATTPRFVEDVLLAQLAAAGAPEGAHVPTTTGKGEPADDPEGLLRGTGGDGEADADLDPEEEESAADPANKDHSVNPTPPQA